MLQLSELILTFVLNMRDEDFFLQKLEHRNIHVTANRLLILRTMWRGGEALSLPQLEKLLLSVDKSTISRTLNLFLQQKLIHCIDDGTGALKYAVCDDDCDCMVEQEHTHFNCMECGRTFCLNNISAPVVPLPEGFTLASINYVLKGLCPQCSEKKKRNGSY